MTRFTLWKESQVKKGKELRTVKCGLTFLREMAVGVMKRQSYTSEIKLCSTFQYLHRFFSRK